MDWKNHKTAVVDNTKQKYIDKYIVGEDILEIGCATGIYSNYLANKNLKVTAIDFDQDLLKKAKTKYKNKNIKFKKANVENLKINKKTFDSAIVFDVLEHVDDLKAIRQISKSTKKIIIGSVPRTTDLELSKNYLLFAHHKDNTHLRTYTKKDLENLFKNINYKKVVIKKTHPISTDGLFLDILEGNIFIKKIIRKLVFLIIKPKVFYSNLMFVIYLK